MTKARNEIPYKSHLRSVKISILMGYYARDKRFNNRAEFIRKQHPTLVRLQWPQIKGLIGHALPQSLSNLDPKEILAYHNALLRMTEDFGLRCDWGPEAIWMYLRFPKARGPIFTFDPVPPSIVVEGVEVPYYPDDTFKDIVKRLPKEMREETRRFRTLLQNKLKAFGYVERRRYFEGNDIAFKSIEWLYQKIALRNSYAKIAENSGYEIETVTTEIKHLRKELSFTRGKPGRPRRVR